MRGCFSAGLLIGSPVFFVQISKRVRKLCKASGISPDVAVHLNCNRTGFKHSHSVLDTVDTATTDQR